MSVLQHKVPYVHSTSYILRTPMLSPNLCSHVSFPLCPFRLCLRPSTSSTYPRLIPPRRPITYSIPPCPALQLPRLPPGPLASNQSMSDLGLSTGPAAQARPLDALHSPTSLTHSPDRVSSSFWLGASYSCTRIDMERIACSNATSVFRCRPYRRRASPVSLPPILPPRSVPDRQRFRAPSRAESGCGRLSTSKSPGTLTPLSTIDEAKTLHHSATNASATRIHRVIDRSSSPPCVVKVSSPVSPAVSSTSASTTWLVRPCHWPPEPPPAIATHARPYHRENSCQAYDNHVFNRNAYL
ncbi:hypothetical protein AUP68_09017 [Ilyonectria robusta]